MKTRMTIVLGLVLAAVAAPAAAEAPLAERMPKGSMMYYAWAGQTEAWAASPAGELMESSKVAEIAETIRDALVQSMPGEAHKQMARNAWAMGATMLKHPCAAALVDIEMREEGDAPPMPKVAVMADLGDDKAAFARNLDKLVEAVNEMDDELNFAERTHGEAGYRAMPVPGPEGVELAFGFDGTVFFACLGGAEMPGQLLATKRPTSLLADETFTAAMKDVDGEDVQAALFLNVTKVKAFARALERREMGPPPAAEGDAEAEAPEGMVARIVDAFGLHGATALAETTRLVEGNMYTRTRLLSPAPHKGLLKLVAERSVSPPDLAAIPAVADVVVVSAVAPQTFVDELRRGLKRVNPQMVEQFDGALGEFRERTGVSLERDLLASLGETWTLCSAPSQGGFFTGTAIWTDVRNAEKLEDSLEKLEAVLRDMIAPPDVTQIPNTCPRCGHEQLDHMEGGWSCPRCGMDQMQWEWQIRRRGGMELRSMQLGETRICYLTGKSGWTPLPVAPAYAVHEGRLYVAGWPQVIQSIIEAGPGEGEGRTAAIADHEAFTKLRGRLAERPAILMYVNTPDIVRRMYPILLFGGTMAMNGLEGQLPVKLNPEWIPSLPAMERFLGPSIAAISADEDGLLCEEFATMPGGGLMGMAPALAPTFGAAGFWALGAADAQPVPMAVPAAGAAAPVAPFPADGAEVIFDEEMEIEIHEARLEDAEAGPCLRVRGTGDDPRELAERVNASAERSAEDGLDAAPEEEADAAADEAPADEAVGRVQMRFQCTECQHEWAPALEDMAERELLIMRETGTHLKCPECGEQAGLPMTQCPQCEKWYISPTMLFIAEQGLSDESPGARAEPPKDVCPHCGTDRIEWYLEQRRK